MRYERRHLSYRPLGTFRGFTNARVKVGGGATRMFVGRQENGHPANVLTKK